MTDKGSVFLVPDKPANWWLNRDSKFMHLPALYGFNHVIEDARVIIRPTGPYLQLVVRPSDHEGSVKLSNWDLSSDLPDDNRSISEDSIAMDFFSGCKSSHENTMVFLSPKMPSVMQQESDRTVSEDPVQKSHVGDKSANQYDSHISQSSLDFEFDSWNDSCELDIYSKSDGPLIHSREFTPEFNSGDLDNDLYVCSLNNLSKTQSSRETTKAKIHVLELGAGLLQKDHRSIPFRY